MDFEKTFPLRYWINLGRRSDRRGEMEWRLAEAGVTAERLPAVDARFVPKMALEKHKVPGDLTMRGYDSAGRYALALTQRMAIRKARQQGAEAVLVFEDDCVFHPNFRGLLASLELPDDWGMFYFGCDHMFEPVPAAPGLVKSSFCVGTHAVAFHSRFFDVFLDVLDAYGKPHPQHAQASDQYLASLHNEIPAYACFPNLAWQSVEDSDLTGTRYSPYMTGGTVHGRRWDDVFDRMYGVHSSIEPKLGLMFLTRGDVNHPEIWREYIQQAPGCVKILSHPKVEKLPAGAFLEGTEIRERHDTAWGNVSLVSASLSLLREALEDDSITHFVLLSESCVPVRPLGEMLRHLRMNGKSRFHWKTPATASDLQQSRAACLPQVPRGCWKFQSQWWLLDRAAAAWVANADYTPEFAAMFAPDEAYFATCLSLLGYPVDDRVVKKDVTWTHWQKGAGSPDSHMRLSKEHQESIVESGAWFARKFPPGADIGSFRLHVP